MRRGLMRWDENELPKAVLLERRARLQAAMRRDRLDGLLIYTNLVRPSAVCWLTGFTPYWIDSLLLVPQDGPPILATALSKRVADWVRSTSYIDEIVNTPRPGSAIGQRLAANGASRIGVLEFDALPGGLFDDLAVAAPAVELSDASEAFTSCRRPIDAAERKLIARADAVAKAALDQPQLTDAGDAGELAGAIEKHARLNAAEEAYIAVAPDLDADRRLIRVTQAVPLGRRFAVRASVAYKGSWVRRTRTFARDNEGAGAAASADAWLAQVVSWRSAGQPLGSFLGAALAAARLGGVEHCRLKSWTAETCKGSYPLEPVASLGLGGNYEPIAGTLLVLSIELTMDDVPWLGAAPMFVTGEPARPR
jgi:hypothetical protein